MSDLAIRLRDAVSSAPRGERKLAVHLFGIDHAAELTGRSVTELAEQAGLGKSYATELYNGVRLARYVERRR